jgi:hypothetical protein
MDKSKLSFCAHCEAMSVRIIQEIPSGGVTLFVFKCAICNDTFEYYDDSGLENEKETTDNL